MQLFWSIAKRPDWVFLGVWLFGSENCDAVAGFGQKMAAWLQVQKKNFIRLHSKQEASFDQKAAEKVANKP